MKHYIHMHRKASQEAMQSVCRCDVVQPLHQLRVHLLASALCRRCCGRGSGGGGSGAAGLVAPSIRDRVLLGGHALSGLLLAHLPAHLPRRLGCGGSGTSW